MKYVLLNFFVITTSFAEIKHERGILTEFFGGFSPGTAYDNWVSHTTEGIASDGFNDYGPPWLDTQTNGFGEHRILTENSETLNYWESIFDNFVIGDTTLVDSLLQDSIGSFFYELVIFEDTSINKIYHIIREQLDTTYIDLNAPDNDDDDVIGSFKNSWGMYIINPSANREQVVIQVPHPCDDFISPYIALKIFIHTDAFGFMIASAGREVAWSEIGNYSNSKSISDPSRYPHTVFQKFQESITQPLIGLHPHWPLIFAIHSFDNATHLPRKSVIMAAGAQNSLTTKPIRDISGNHFDIINFTSEYPIEAYQFSNPNPLHVTDYYEVFYDDYCMYDNGEDEFSITLASELRGSPTGIQMLDLQSQVSNYSVYEPWIHIELDEKPMLFDNIELPDDTLYNNGLFPIGFHNFSMIIEYYQPFIDAIENYLSHWETIPDITSPDSIESIMAYNVDNSDQVYLNWSPVYDTNFKSFQIKADTDTSFNNPLLFDLSDYEMLQFMRRDHETLEGLNNTESWWFQIRATDYFDNTGPWSKSVSNLLPGHSSPDTLLFFNNTLPIQSIFNEDVDEQSFIIDTNNTIPGNSPTLALFGNTWKSIQIDPFALDTSTVLQVFVRIDSISEIQGIGFANIDNNIRYSFSGLETLNIEEWIPVYQGVNPHGSWYSYRFPIGNDWLAWYDTLSIINEIHFINDHDDTNSVPGGIHFSMIRDLTPDLPIPPLVSINYNLGNIRSNNNIEMVSVSFESVVQDTDSYYFLYHWEFGDGQSSNEPNPSHDYFVEDDHEYSVMLIVEDETGKQGFATTSIQLDQGNSSFPITLNFVGDIMMGRRFEDIDGIITTQGVEALFEPTLDILGLAADVTIANLEIPLSNQGFPHPTKSVIFRSSPENVSGLIYAGIDVVSLANNHILDYMEPALIQTQNILNEAAILHSGAGLNSYDAYLPAFKSVKGQTIAFLASSDRTGQYNNYQPYLNAGENKSGFAYMTPYYLRQQIESVENIADIIIVEMHAGSEYSIEPSENYDSFTLPDRLKNLRINPASQVGFIENPKYGLDTEDYSWRLDRPKLWDRAIRHFAIDEGADLVIVHHPHIIQGVEVYNGKLIAHSLGNFIFDLNYPETYPSMILNASANENGLIDYTITPLYIDDYLTGPATGELGNFILDYIAMRSKELGTHVHVDTDNQRAVVILDTLSSETEHVDYNAWVVNFKPVQLFGESSFVSEPIKIAKAGSLSEILNGNTIISHYRLGREKIWMNNFENEGSTLWNLNSESEVLQDSIFRRGSMGLLHIRTQDSPDNIVTDLEERIPFYKEFSHTLHGTIKTNNAKNVTLEARFYEGRTGESLSTTSINDSISGNTGWQKYWDEIPIQEEANFFNIRMNSDVPDSGYSYSFFDDVGFIQWDSLVSISEYPIAIPHPNDFEYIQLFFSQTEIDLFGLALRNTIIGPLESLASYPKVVQSVVTVPGNFYFFDESKGAVGNKHWLFGQETEGVGETPFWFCENPGIYEVSLSVTGPNGQESIGVINVVGIAEDSEGYLLGDVNGDGFITVVDAILSANYILGVINLQPEEFLATDIDGNTRINIFDLLLISDLAN